MADLFDGQTPGLNSRLYKICMVIARLGLAYLFFTQLWWKLPPRFGCDSEYNFPKAAEQNFYDSNNSSGLCFWMGLKSIYASQPRQVLVADMRQAGLPAISVSITPLARLNAVLLDNLIIPQIGVFGWLVWLAEFWIFLSMLLGLFHAAGGAGIHRDIAPAIYRSGKHPAPLRMGVELRSHRPPVDRYAGGGGRTGIRRQTAGCVADWLSLPRAGASWQKSNSCSAKE